MEENTLRLVGDILLGIGFFLFVAGAAVLVLDYQLPFNPAVVGALALIFAGFGASMKNTGRIQIQ